MFNPQLLRLYWVLDPDQCNCLPADLINSAEEAIKGGVTLIQWRAPNWSQERQRAILPALKKLCDHYALPLIINNHVELAKEFDAAGVHLGQSDMPVIEARAQLGADKIIGLSISNEAQLMAIPENIVNYIGVGPVWETMSKRNAPPPLGVPLFKALAQKSPYPIVAIGGINATNIEQLKSIGNCYGVAVISAISREQDFYRAASRLINALH